MRTITKCEVELRELARFVPETGRIDDLLAYRFEEGLNPELRAVVEIVGV